MYIGCHVSVKTVYCCRQHMADTVLFTYTLHVYYKQTLVCKSYDGVNRLNCHSIAINAHEATE